jgi:predicted RNA-binding protein
MCQATVYLICNGQEDEIMKDVISLEPTEGGLRLKSLFEEPKIVQGRIERIDFLKHKITIVAEEEGN